MGWEPRSGLSGARVTQEEWHVGVLPDLMYRLRSGQLQPCLMYGESQASLMGLAGDPLWRRMSLKGRFQLLPRDQLGQKHPAIVWVEFSAKR